MEDSDRETPREREDRGIIQGQQMKGTTHERENEHQIENGKGRDISKYLRSSRYDE